MLDNRDSFVFNLVHRLFEVGARDLVVVRSDEVSAEEIERWAPRALVLSPGPGHPREAGCTIEVIARMSGRVPMLGVCLGHQAIVEAFGGEVRANGTPRHGQRSRVEVSGGRLFEGMAPALEVGRYHSLSAVEPLPPDLRVTARLAAAEVGEGMVMAVEHVTHPTFGVQFHPESVLTGAWRQMFSNFMGFLEGA